MATKLILQQPYKKREKGKKKIPNDKETRIYLFLIIKRGQVIKVKTGFTIHPREWDFRLQQKTSKLAGAIEFNRSLLELKNDIDTEFSRIKKAYPDMPFNQVSVLLKEYGRNLELHFKDDEKGFFDFFGDYIDFLKTENSPRTVQKFKTLERSLKEFTSTTKKYRMLSFSMVDHSFKDSYVSYLKNQKPRGRQKSRPEGAQVGVLIDTEKKYIGDFKTFLKWAEARKFNHYTTYKEFSAVTASNRKRQKKRNDIVTLTLPELLQLYNHDFSENKSLERIRDLWCFGAFTCQRWADISRFDKSQLEDDIWTFNADKTKKETSVDFVGFAAPALDILRKYDYKLPGISLAKFNLLIKNAAKIAGINSQTTIIRFVGVKEIAISGPKYKFISSHSARRSGISILLNDYNIPISHMLELTQHADLKTLQAYINPDRESRRAAFSKTKRIDELLTVVKEKAG